MIYFNYNGKHFAAGTPVIGADSRALRYGDGIFETMRMNADKIEFAEEHFARLWKGMQVLRFDIPKHFSPEQLQQEITALVKRNGYTAAVRIRLSIFRGDGGLFDVKSHAPNYIIQCWPIAETTSGWNTNGLVTGFCPDVNKSCDVLSNLKHNNYLPYAMAALHAKKQRWNDAIVLNSRGNICDSTIANIFMIKGETIITPSLAEGCVAGVMRYALLNFLTSNGWSITEKPISPDELADADEVFFTNSMYHIRWVQSVHEHTYGNALTQKIYAAFLPTI
jgi:branched-chain amino acid aminotransferase